MNSGGVFLVGFVCLFGFRRVFFWYSCLTPEEPLLKNTAAGLYIYFYV